MPDRAFSRFRPLLAASVLLCLVVLRAPGPAFGWGPGGHMMVAKIAFDRLNPRARAEALRLLAIPINPAGVTNKRKDFFTASVWADDVKKMDGFEFSGDEHFADFPFSVDNTRLPRLPKEANVINALERYVGVLKTSADQNERAEALRFIIHYVGDIHQPLHCSTRVSRSLRRGDEGGNLFFVRVPGAKGALTKVKLHSYWDGGLGSFPRGGPPPTFAPPPQEQINSAARGVVRDNPDTDAQLNLGEPTDFRGWADESSALAQKFAYGKLVPDGKTTAAYRKKGMEVARRRVAWGGYRLAALLNSVWPE